MKRPIRILLSIVSALIVASVWVYICGPFLPMQHDRVFYNGTVLSVDRDGSVHSAIAIRDGLIVARGDYASVIDSVAWTAQVTDLQGRTIIPGFVDAHGHFPATGLMAVAANLYNTPDGPIRTMADLIAGLKERAEAPKPDGVVFGFGYDDTAIAELRHPTRNDLDQVSTDLPVLAKHSSGHITAVNSRALELMGIDADTPDPDGGHIERDAESGEATGVLFETAADHADQMFKGIDLGDSLAVTRLAAAGYVSNGVTTAQSGKADHRFVNALARATRLGIVPLRLVVWPDEEVSEEIINGSYDVDALQSDWFTVGAHKLTADGSVQGYTSYLTRPYHTPYKGDAGYRGFARQSREVLAEKVERIYRSGFQVATHGNADAAIDDILYALERAQRLHAREDARPLIIHAQITRPDQLDKMAELSISPSFFGLHVYYWGDRHRELFLGLERAEYISPARAAKDRGLRFTLHNDAPVVSNVSPLFIMWTAVNRLTSSGRILGEDQRISVMDALRAVTIDAAWQVFLEGTRGSIEVGKYADLVVLDKNPMEHPATLKDIQVLETIVDGRTVFSKW
jgi:hypothetical protein